MEIEIVWGKSEGLTRISAFDKALAQAGIHNFNLIYLSSVIPVGAVVREVGNYQSRQGVGSLLYVVMASYGSNRPNTQISAGLGWVKTEEGGLFFESKGEFTPEECEKEIETGLGEMMSMRNWNGQISMKVVTHQVREIANVMVAAVYDFEG